MVMLSPSGTSETYFDAGSLSSQLALLSQLQDHGGRHRLGIGGDPEMRIGLRRRCAAQRRRAGAEDEFSLGRAQQNHGAGQHELFGCRFHAGSKCNRVERPEICCRRGRSAERARHGKGQVPGFALSIFHSLVTLRSFMVGRTALATRHFGSCGRRPSTALAKIWM